MKERFEFLFHQYLESRASKEELEEFLLYVEKAKNDQDLRELIHQVYREIRDLEQAPISYIDEAGNLILNTSEASPAMAAGEGWPEEKRRRKIFSVPALILCLLLLGGTAWWLSIIKDKRGSLMTASRTLTKKFTERAEFKYLLLPDSTQVWLNANSSLEYPDDLQDKKREVFLIGEAYFDVRHAEERPFIIHTGKVVTTVLGTAFNIKAYPFSKNVQVTVSKGKVQVSRNEQMIAILQKGQQIRVGEADTAIRRRSIDAEKVNFWQKGMLSYDDESIGEIIQDLEQVYNLDIQVNDPSLLQTRITTSFDRNVGVTQALKIISRLVDRQVNYRNGSYVIE